MYIVDGIAYAGERETPLKVSSIRAMDDYRLWVRFSTGATKLFDFKPLLDSPAYQPLKDPELFRDVYVDYGVPVWLNGEVDIAPEALFDGGLSDE